MREGEAEAYAFLVGTLIDTPTLARAIRIARRWRTLPHRVLIALGWLPLATYERAVAYHLGIPLIDPTTYSALGESATMLEAAALRPDEIAAWVARERDAGRGAVLTRKSAHVASHAELSEPPDIAIESASRGLKLRHPAQSAGTPMWLWQRIAGVTCGGLLAGSSVVAPSETLALLFALIALPFVAVTMIRVMALWHLMLPNRASFSKVSNDRAFPDALLPIYTVLVPLYDEAEVVSGLVAALSLINYPYDKLDIMILVEAGDVATRRQLDAQQLPAYMRQVVVPSGMPRTKPRALNFGLRYARGDFVVVYDAEDIPEPDQLRHAYAVLRARPEEVGCVQARLNIYNPKASWLARQFTIEYSALFDGLLPTLEQHDLPILLGGTSNHFPGIR